MRIIHIPIDPLNDTTKQLRRALDIMLSMINAIDTDLFGRQPMGTIDRGGGPPTPHRSIFFCHATLVGQRHSAVIVLFHRIYYPTEPQASRALLQAHIKSLRAHLKKRLA